MTNQNDDYFDNEESFEKEEDKDTNMCHRGYPCGNCMRCLGLSWRDFL